MKILVEFDSNEETELNNLTFLNAIIKFINEHNGWRVKRPTLFKADEFLDFLAMTKMYIAQAEFCQEIIKNIKEANNGKVD